MKNLILLAFVMLSTSLAFATPTFFADDFLVVAIEYASPHELAGVSTFGPSDKEALCQQSSAALTTEAPGIVPKGHRLVTTCLHVKFSGPLSDRGAVIVQPFAGKPLQYVQVGVEFTDTGAFRGAQALSQTDDALTCQKEARDLIDSNVKDGKITSGNSLLIYCLPVPPLPTPETEGGII